MEKSNFYLIKGMIQISNYGEKVIIIFELEKSELWCVGMICIEYLFLGKIGIQILKFL